MGTLHPHVLEQVLLATFLPSEPISFVQVCRDRITVSLVGLVFVIFAHRYNVENALNTLMFSHGQDDVKTVRVWVMGLSLFPNLMIPL